MRAYVYSYTDSSLPVWGFQVELVTRAGWGHALAASTQGLAAGVGACTRIRSAYPRQPVMPFGARGKGGDSQFRTTATAVGAVGRCATNWEVLFTHPNYNPALVNLSMNEIRCDNVVGANLNRPRRVGCVVPWYASAVSYSRTRYPALAAHVQRAQTSGLPGNSFARPLTRTTNQATINRNRRLACGSAPSIPGFQCDEYPLATTNQGLAFGGRLRTFANCNINAPLGQTGPRGASACMIPAAQNSAQGAMMAAFYYDQRVINGDPYQVHIGA